MTDEKIENIITHDGERDLEKIPVQKCILSHEHGSVSFEDELEHDNYIFKTDCACEITGLVQSCKKSFSAGYPEPEIFTCTCGIPACAGIYDVYSLNKDGQIYICVNDEFLFHFDREQFTSEVLRLLENMLDELKTEYALYPFAGIIIDDDQIIELIKSLKPDYDFSDYQQAQKHKILIVGGGEHIYRGIDKEWHDFEDDGSLVFYEIGSESVKIKIEGLQEWSDEIEAYETSHKISGMEDFSWDDWNKRGMDYAKIIASHLPKNYAVYYEYYPLDNISCDKIPIRI